MEKYFYSKKMLIFIYLPGIFSSIMSLFMIYISYLSKTETLESPTYISVLVPFVIVSSIFITFHKVVRGNCDKISELEEKIKRIENKQNPEWRTTVPDFGHYIDN